MKYVSSKDVAKKAGVSQTTVSRVYNDNYTGNISAESRAKVYKAAKELNYVPNRLANLVRTKKTNLIGLILPEGSLSTYNTYLSRFIEAFEPSKQIIAVPVDPLKDADEAAIKLASFSVEAIVLLSTLVSKDCVDLMNHKNIKIISINKKIIGVETNTIMNDYYEAGVKVAKYFKSKEYKNVCLVSGTLHPFHEPLREEGFVKGCNTLGLNLKCRIEGNYSYHLKTEDIEMLIKNLETIDGIFCANDNMAYYILDELRKKQLESKIDIVGFDNTFPSSLHAYHLSTVAIPYNDIIQKTLNLCNDTESNDPDHLLLSLELIIRN